MGIIQTHAPAIFSIIVFILMRFRPFSTVHTNTICMRFRFDPLSKALQIENAQRMSVDGRPKRIEMCAFLSENALVWMRPQGVDHAPIILQSAYRVHTRHEYTRN